MLYVRFLALVVILNDFYFWIIIDGVLMYTLVAACNGLLYRRKMGPRAAAPV